MHELELELTELEQVTPAGFELLVLLVTGAGGADEAGGGDGGRGGVLAISALEDKAPLGMERNKYKRNVKSRCVRCYVIVYMKPPRYLGNTTTGYYNS